MHDHGMTRHNLIPQGRPVAPHSAQFSISSPTDDCEREADRVAAAVVHGGFAPTVVGSSHAEANVQRQMDESEPSADEEDEKREEPENGLPEGLERDGLILAARLPGTMSTPPSPLSAGRTVDR
jgi:hypothetical protein